MTSNANLVISLFDPAWHERQGFSCGELSLDAYLHSQASQDIKRRAAVLYVLTETEDDSAVLGYYTLSACSVRLSGLPLATQKKLSRYPDVAGALIGRLAVDTSRKGTGLGAVLLRHALRRCLEQSRELAIAVIVVDALNENARQFYERYGFVELSEGENRLFLPVATLAQAGTQKHPSTFPSASSPGSSTRPATLGRWPVSPPRLPAAATTPTTTTAISSLILTAGWRTRTARSRGPG